MQSTFAGETAHRLLILMFECLIKSMGKVQLVTRKNTAEAALHIILDLPQLDIFC